MRQKYECETEPRSKSAYMDMTTVYSRAVVGMTLMDAVANAPRGVDVRVVRKDGKIVPPWINKCIAWPQIVDVEVNGEHVVSAYDHAKGVSGDWT